MELTYQIELLRLKEAISNPPHAQQLASQFANDAQEINHLLQIFNKACSDVYHAQESLAQSYLQMSEIARVVGGKNLTVQPKDVNFENICLQFSSLLEELAGMHRAHAEEMMATVFMPAHKLPSQPGLQLLDNASGNVSFCDLPATRRNFEACDQDFHASLVKYMKLTRRCTPKEHDDIVMDLSESRRRFQKASVTYYARLNAAHFEREIIPLNAFFGFLTTVRNHSKKIVEVTDQPSLADFCEVVKEQVDCRQVRVTQAAEELLNTLTHIQRQPPASFAPEPLFSKSDRSYLRTPDGNLLSKSGYLCKRVKKTFGFDWNEVYCFTHAGNLMCQQKGDLAAGVLVNLNNKGVFAEPVDIDDRRYTFQIVTASERSEETQQQQPQQQQQLAQSLARFIFTSRGETSSVVLQAENSTDRDEWISTISNVILHTGGWAPKGASSPDSIARGEEEEEPLPFVLLPEPQPSDNPETGTLSEDLELQQALRASLSCTDWIAQSPPLHCELISIERSPCPPQLEVHLEVPFTFLGCMPLPEFLVNPASVEEITTHLLSRRPSKGQLEGRSYVGQSCLARITSEAVFIVEPANGGGIVLEEFKLQQIVHCWDMSANRPGLLALLTSVPHSSQWCDLPLGNLHLCHVFETSRPSDFAERVLNLQLMRLATLTGDGDLPEKTCIMANIVRSSEWGAPQMPRRVPSPPPPPAVPIASPPPTQEPVPASPALPPASSSSSSPYQLQFSEASLRTESRHSSVIAEENPADAKETVEVPRLERARGLGDAAEPAVPSVTPTEVEPKVTAAGEPTDDLPVSG